MKCAILSVLITGCVSLAPRYQRPLAPIAAQLPGGSGSALATELPWRELVRDPRLRQVIDLALAGSRDLRKAVLAIEAARSQHRIQRGQRLPAVDAAAVVTTSRELVGPGNATATGTIYSLPSVMASWEIDVFGELKSLSDAKLQVYLSTIEAAKAVQISLVAEIASAYLTLAADRSRLAIARDTLESSRQTVELTQRRIGGGISNRSEFWLATTSYQQARFEVAALGATILQDRNALELLAGRALAEELLPETLPVQPDWFAEVPVGLSSQVLLTRPDVLAAEHDLIAANASIGAARARFFPSLTLTASGGLASAALAALFTGPAAVFALAPSFRLPLFRGGALRAGLALSEAQKQIFVANYELTIQHAFREVADALATRGTIEEQLAAQVALVESATKAFELAQARYQSGVDIFLTTLVAQRELYAAQRSLLATQLSAALNRVTLYRVLGGGAR